MRIWEHQQKPKFCCVLKIKNISCKFFVAICLCCREYCVTHHMSMKQRTEFQTLDLTGDYLQSEFIIRSASKQNCCQFHSCVHHLIHLFLFVSEFCFAAVCILLLSLRMACYCCILCGPLTFLIWLHVHVQHFGSESCV